MTLGKRLILDQQEGMAKLEGGRLVGKSDQSRHLVILSGAMKSAKAEFMRSRRIPNYRVLFGGVQAFSPWRTGDPPAFLVVGSSEWTLCQRFRIGRCASFRFRAVMLVDMLLVMPEIDAGNMRADFDRCVEL
jgi:hypothetical protein